MRAEMSFASRTVIVFVIMLLLEYYFIKKAGGTITAVFPGVRWKKLNTLRKLILGLVVFFILYVPTRIIFDYYAVSIRNVIFTKQGLNPALNDFRLVMISDLHADRHTDSKRLGNYIDKVNNLKPDLVLIGGDMISGNSQYIDTAAEYVGKIKAQYGVFSCRGDHDYWAYRPDMQRSVGEITDALGRYKVPMLNNENLRLVINGAKMLISFITYTLSLIHI